MTAAELNDLARAVFGERWQSALSRELGVPLRTVQRWAAEGIPKKIVADAVWFAIMKAREARRAG